MNFDFKNEMIYNKKHLDKVSIKNNYKFIDLVSELFDCELNNVHNSTEKKYDLFTELGKDTQTIYHKIFYQKLNEGWNEIKNEYDNFIKNEILPYLGLEEALIQQFPTFRVQLPNNVAVVINHYDSDDKHKHPTGEINFIYALTDMYDTNTIYVETMPRLEEYEPILLNAGECICFNGNKCSHHNKINKTGKTRVSWDFRVLPLNYYDQNSGLESVTTNKKYIEGGYYKRIKVDNKILIDPWNKEKLKFNNTMEKYNVNDAWGIVDIFEKKIAEYSGSKYAISVDNCTNALYLCMKYLNASGTITLPSKTWISVPCSVIHADCKVDFEDYNWSGKYQLKPYPIWDGAVQMKRGMYQSGTYHCLSFHIRKHIPIGKGGMILTDDKKAYDWFRTVRYEGRSMSDDGITYKLYKDDDIKSLGWNMYMTPEQAARGLELFERIEDDNPDQESSGTSKDLEKLGIYQNEQKKVSYDSVKLDVIFNNFIDKGIYVDVGVREGVHDNKTFLMYLNNHTGITIDAHPDYISICKKMRPNDKTICIICGDDDNNCKFRYNWRGSFSSIYIKDLDENRSKYINGGSAGDCWYGEVDDTKDYLGFKNSIEHNISKSLNTILDEYNIENKEIDILSIDIDGSETELLKNFDIKKYNPKLVCIELEKHISASKDNNNYIINYMKNNNYIYMGYINEDHIWINNKENKEKFDKILNTINLDEYEYIKFGHPCNFLYEKNLKLNNESIELYKNLVYNMIK
jgi:hypothetical protein